MTTNVIDKFQPVTKEVDASGFTRFRNSKGKLHQNGDEPAVISEDYKEFWKNGKLHRDGDKPAVVGKGLRMYYQKGKLHRANGKPAVVSIVVEYYENGVKHREGGKPATQGGFEDPEYWIRGKYKHKALVEQ